MMKSWFRNTPGGKMGSIDGLNLFFGALLGANLGTIQGMGLGDYIKMVVLLAGTVMLLRMLSTSERRGQMLIILAVYVVLMVAIVTVPDLKPDGMAKDDLNRLVATLGVWVTLVLATELSPMEKDAGPDKDHA